MSYLLNNNYRLSGKTLLIICLSFLFISVALTAEPARVLIIKSHPRTDLEKSAQDQTLNGIISVLRQQGHNPVIEKDFSEEKLELEKDYWTAIIKQKPEVILTVGTPATRSAIINVKHIPIVYTMVFDNIEQLIASGNSQDIGGITLAIPFKKQLETMKKSLPEAKRVGLIYPINSSDEYRSVEKLAEKNELRLISAEISTERDIPVALRKILPEVDVFWMPPEALTYERNNCRFILLECFQNGVPIMAVSKQKAIMGAPLALGIDYKDIGMQTAELAQKRLSQGPFKQALREPPRRVLLYINEKVAQSLGLDIPVSMAQNVYPIRQLDK